MYSRGTNKQRVFLFKIINYETNFVFNTSWRDKQNLVIKQKLQINYWGFCEETKSN